MLCPLPGEQFQDLKIRSAGGTGEDLPPPGVTEQQPLHVVMVSR